MGTPESVVQPLDYSLFKSELHPSWEDDVVCQGGRWVAKMDKEYTYVNVIIG